MSKPAAPPPPVKHVLSRKLPTVKLQTFAQTLLYLPLIAKRKVNGHPRTGHEGPERE
jgi:hypothetical protein